jgi:hypothetical protein
MDQGSPNFADFELVKIPAVDSLQKAYDMVRDKYGRDLRVGNFPCNKGIVPSEMPARSFTGEST